MRIGIISNEPRVGKTTLMMSLALTFSRSQGKRVAIFSTGSLDHVVSPLHKTQNTKDTTNSPSVFNAMLKTKTISGTQLFDYSVRAGRDQVYIFDLFDRGNDVSETLDFLASTLKTITADMILVEIHGNPNSPSNKPIVNACDCVLDVFNMDLASIESLNLYLKDLSPRERKKTLLVCNQYNETIAGEKKLSGITKIPQKDVLCADYCPGVAKLLLDGDVSGVADKVVAGQDGLTKYRSRMEKLMQALYDSPGRTRIIPVAKWDIGGRRLETGK